MVEPIKRKAPPKGALERIAEIEQTIPRLIQAMNSAMQEQFERINAMAEVVDAVVSDLGRDKVQALVDAARKKRADDRVQQDIDYMKAQVEAGAIVPTEFFTLTSIVVGVEYDQEGKAVPPGRLRLPAMQILPELRDALVGKPIGTRLETAANTIFEVLELYEPQLVQTQVIEPSEVEPAAEAG
jgi:hypothetical protein